MTTRSSNSSSHHSCCLGHCKWNDHNFSKWLNETSIHGIVHVFKGHSAIRRILWGLIFTIALIGCSYNIIESFRYYFSRPIATTIIYENGDTLPFPAVTVCDLNILQYPNEDNLTNIIEYIFNPEISFFSEILQEYYSCEDSIKVLDKTQLNTTILNWLNQDIKEFVLFCGFSDSNGIVIRCEDDLQPILTSTGICYTFNSISNGKPDIQVTSTGIKSGLKMILNVTRGSMDYEEKIGVKVVISERDILPVPHSQGVAIPPDRSAYIGLNKFKKVDQTTHSSCIPNDRHVSLFPSLQYSQGACEHEQVLTQQLFLCGCLPEEPPIKYANTPTCTIADICCLMNQSIVFNNEYCPPPCNVVSYEEQVSYFQNSNRLITKILKKERNISIDSSTSLVSLSVFFENLEVTNTIAEDAYSSVSLLANIGGHLGLFIGASVISLLEMGVFIFDELKRVLLSRRLQNRMHQLDEHIEFLEVVEENEEEVSKEEETRETESLVTANFDCSTNN